MNCSTEDQTNHVMFNDDYLEKLQSIHFSLPLGGTEVVAPLAIASESHVKMASFQN